LIKLGDVLCMAVHLGIQAPPDLTRLLSIVADRSSPSTKAGKARRMFGALLDSTQPDTCTKQQKRSQSGTHQPWNFWGKWMQIDKIITIGELTRSSLFQKT
jgi:hypothetical protein